MPMQSLDATLKDSVGNRVQLRGFLLGQYPDNVYLAGFKGGRVKLAYSTSEIGDILRTSLHSGNGIAIEGLLLRQNGEYIFEVCGVATGRGATGSYVMQAPDPDLDELLNTTLNLNRVIEGTIRTALEVAAGSRVDAAALLGLTLEGLAAQLREYPTPRQSAVDSDKPTGYPLKAHQSLKDRGLVHLSEVEKEYILRALQYTKGNKKAAAIVLGISRRALYRRIERLGLGDESIQRRPRRNV